MINYAASLRRRTSEGFTLVELLIAIVVIAVLAAISVVTFNGIQDRANKSALSSALTNTTKRVELDKVTRGSYVTQLNQLENSTTSGSDGVEYQYSSDGQAYCLTAILGKFAMHTSSTNQEASEGTCEGHDEPDVGPVVDPVVYTQAGSFEERQPVEGGGVVRTIDIAYDVQPTDYVFVLFNARYNALIELTDSSGANASPLYQRSMGVSGYQRHYAFGINGQTAEQPLTVTACWTLQCDGYTPTLSAAYVVYVIRGLGTSPTLSATYTDYGVFPGAGVTVATPTQSLKKRKLAIFSPVFYGNNLPTGSDASSPSMTWISDSTAPSTHSGTAIISLHSYAPAPTTVGYQMTMSTSGTSYYGSTLFTLQ